MLSISPVIGAWDIYRKAILFLPRLFFKIKARKLRLNSSLK